MCKKVLFFSFILIFSIISTALSEKTDKERLTQEIMQKSGLNIQIQNTPDELSAIVKQLYKSAPGNFAGSTDNIVKQLNLIIMKSFNPDIIRSVIADHIRTELSAEEMRLVLGWLNSPLGSKITRIEEMASTAEGYLDKASTLPLLKESVDYNERAGLMEKLDRHFHATESTLDRWINSQLVYRTAVRYAFPAVDMPSKQALMANFEIYKHAMKKQISENISSTFLYTYRDLNLDEIRRYIRFIKTGYGEKYHRVVIKGRTKAELFCRKKFGENVGKIMADKSKNNFSKPDVHDYPQRN